MQSDPAIFVRWSLVAAFGLLAVGGDLTSTWAGSGGTTADVVLEEIVVTARRREERLVDTPIAVSAISDLDIERRNLQDLTDVGRLVPNMAFDLGTGSTGSANNAQVFIRGIGQQDFLFTSDPGVGLYIDGVYYPRGTGIVMDLVDLESIQVLRGPQGTLFGKNTIGGAILITSKAPDETLGAHTSLTFGSRDRTDAEATLNVPLIDNRLSLRVAGSTRHRDGYVDRVLARDDLGDVESHYGRARLRWTPSNDLMVDLSADLTRKRESSVAEELVDVRPEDPSNPLLGLWNVLVAPTLGPGVQMDRRFLSDDYESQATGANFSNFDMFGASLVVEKHFTERLSFKSITAYREQDSQFAADNDHSPFRYTESTNDNEHDQWSQELQVNGSFANGRVNWVLGAFYMKEDGRDLFDVALGSGLYTALESLPAPLIPLAPGVVCPPPPGAFLPCAGGAGNPINVSLDLDVLITDEIDIKTYAAFGEANFDITEALSATLGLRYSHDKKTFTTSLLRRTAGIITLPETTISDKWDDVSPRFGVEYQLRDDMMIYASATAGFKSGGFNGRAQTLAEIDSFDPEEVRAYEIGFKSTTQDNRLGFNLSAFVNDYTDMQLISVRDVQGLIVVVTENAGEVDIKGIEGELLALPAEGLNLRLGVGYLDAEYTKLDASATVTRDDRLVKTPKWTLSAAVDYAIPLGNRGTVRTGADVAYRSRYANELTNEPPLNQDGFAVWGAYVEYVPRSERWAISLFGRNLGDERYKTNALSAFGSFGNATANYGPPREWGVRVQARLQE